MPPTPAKQQWGYGLPDQAVTSPPAAPASRWGRIRGDLVGGTVAGLLTIPTAMSYGILALAPLGPDLIAQGIMAGLYAVVCGCIAGVILGANTPMIYAPRSIITFLIGSIVLQNFARSSHEAIGALSASMLLSLIFLLVFIAGAIQAAFGALRLGSLVKYLPAPVLAGFQNAAAILIFFSQINPMLGLAGHVTLLSLADHLSSIQPLTLLVGTTTVLLSVYGGRLSNRIAPSMLGFFGGTLLYYLLVALGLGAHLGPVIGNIPFSLPTLQYARDFADFLSLPEYASILPVLLYSALSLAIVASLDGLLCARLVESDSGHRFHGNRELMRLGLGNMITGLFGGISNGINLASSFANHRAGGRTRISVLTTGLVVLAAMAMLTPLIGLLPRVVIAAMLVTVAIQLIDRWTLHIFTKAVKDESGDRYGIIVDLAIILLVATLAIAANIVMAVFLGFLVTVGVFLFRMSKSVIRREYRCDAVHSRKTREPRLMTALSEHGSRIVVIELEGPLFFGTAENLALHLEQLLDSDTAYVVIDLKRVNDMDSTGARVLVGINDKLVKKGKHLLLSAPAMHLPATDALRQIGVAAAVGAGRIFPDVDTAIEWAEDHLLLRVLGDTELAGEFPFSRFDVFARMTDTEIAAVKPLLDRRVYRAGETVFREGDEGKELFMIAKGCASVRIRLPGENRSARLITFSPGTIFGELALLDQEVRSATIEADEDLTCYILSHDAFEQLTETSPAIAIKLLASLGRELAGRLRRANRTIYQLDS